MWNSESSLHKHNICYIFLKFCQINGSSNITIGKRHCHDNSIKNPITLSFPISSKYWKSFASQKPQGNEYKPLLLPLFTLAVLQTPTLKVISHVVKHKLIERNTWIVFLKHFLLIRKQTYSIGKTISCIVVWVAIVFWIMQRINESGVLRYIKWNHLHKFWTLGTNTNYNLNESVDEEAEIWFNTTWNTMDFF